MLTNMEHEQHKLGIPAALTKLAAFYFCLGIWVSPPGFCQTGEPDISQGRHHPDGMVSRLSIYGLADYASVSRNSTGGAADAQTYRLGLDLVAANRLTVITRYELLNQDSVRHFFKGGFKFYLKDPLQEGGDCNPDGPVMGVVLNLAVGSRSYSGPDGHTRWLADVGAAVPVSKRLSLAAGYRFYEEIEASDVMQVYGGMSLNYADYPTDSVYVNPDGPVGYPVINLTGGGSSKGLFARVTFTLPIRQELSLRAGFGAERIRSQHYLALTASIGLSIYPRR